MCIRDLHLVALGNLCDWGFLVTLGDCHHLDGLVDYGLRCEAHVVIVRCSEEEIVRSIVLAQRELQRATLVERVIELPSLLG